LMATKRYLSHLATIMMQECLSSNLNRCRWQFWQWCGGQTLLML